MELVAEYWAQITLILGVIGYIIKTILDNRLKNKELKFKYFYEIKSAKIIELYTKIVEIQMIIDRKKKGEGNSFEGNVFKNRIALDKYYWESHFYFSEKTKKSFHQYLEWLMYFESKELMTENPEIEFQFDKITKSLIKEFKKEIK
jgi:hypothetical protein